MSEEQRFYLEWGESLNSRIDLSEFAKIFQLRICDTVGNLGNIALYIRARSNKLYA
jgi:hypothetical protein